jgi:hypothetical protein
MSVCDLLRDRLRALRAAMTFEAAARKRTQRNGDRGKTNNRDAWHDLPHSSELAPSLHPAPRKGEREEISRTPGVGAGLKPAPTRPDFAACGMKWWREGFESRPQHEP